MAQSAKAIARDATQFDVTSSVLKTKARTYIFDPGRKIHDVTASGAAVAWSLSEGMVLELTNVNANVTVTVTDDRSGGTDFIDELNEVVISAAQDGTGGRTVTLAGALGARTVTLSSTAANAIGSTSLQRVATSGTALDDWYEEVSSTSRKELQDSVAFSATPTIDFDADTADNKSMAAMTANVTASTLTFTRPGWYTLEVLQDGTGGRTWTWQANMEWTGAIPQPNLTADKATVFHIYYNGTNPRIVSHG